MPMPDIHDAARGRWRGILSSMGLDQKTLSGKHGSCPICDGGKDRFRFDDKGGRGTWICNVCGAGTGIDLVMKLRGLDFKEAVAAVRPLVGLASPEQPKPGLTDDAKRRLRRELWESSRPVEKGDPVDAYLESRGVARPAYSPALRYCPEARYAEGQSFDAMIAAVQDGAGSGVTLQRIFIKDGQKAPVDQPRMLMPGEFPAGSAVRLAPQMATMGVAEGIETALAAWEIFGVPTWALISAGNMTEWEPPMGVEEVWIFGDNDASFTGQAAAYGLARRLARKKYRVEVRIPSEVDTDWLDHLGAEI